MKKITTLSLCGLLVFAAACGGDESTNHPPLTTPDSSNSVVPPNTNTKTAARQPMNCPNPICPDPGPAQQNERVNCNDQATWDQNMLDHEICADCFNQRIHGRAADIIKTRDQLQIIADSMQCPGFIVSNGSCNDFIKRSGYAGMLTNTISYMLVRGFLRMTEMQKMEFYCWNAISHNYLLFRALDATNNPIYYGDITELSPAPPVTPSASANKNGK